MKKIILVTVLCLLLIGTSAVVLAGEEVNIYEKYIAQSESNSPGNNYLVNYNFEDQRKFANVDFNFERESNIYVTEKDIVDRINMDMRIPDDSSLSFEISTEGEVRYNANWYERMSFGGTENIEEVNLDSMGMGLSYQIGNVNIKFSYSQ